MGVVSVQILNFGVALAMGGGVSVLGRPRQRPHPSLISVATRGWMSVRVVGQCTAIVSCALPFPTVFWVLAPLTPFVTTMPLPVNGNTLVMRDADVQTCAEVAQELMANPTLTDVRLRGMRWCWDNPVRPSGRRVSLGVRISTRFSVVEWCGAAELRATLGPPTKTCPSYNRRCVPWVHRLPTAMLMQNGTTRCQMVNARRW